MDEVKETRKYWEIERGSARSSLWRTRFGRGSGSVEADRIMNE